MLIASMGGRQEGMALLVMEDDQFATPQDLPTQLAHGPSGHKDVTLDRFALAIKVEDRLRRLLVWLRLGVLVMPQRPGPLGHRIGQRLVRSGMRQPSKELLNIRLTVGTAAPSHQRQQRSGVGAEIPGAGQTSNRQKQQGQHQAFDHGQGERQAAGASGPGDALDRGQERAQEPRLVGRRQEQQAPSAFLPYRLGLRQVFSVRAKVTSKQRSPSEPPAKPGTADADDGSESV